jgi:tetratricopeptide (TPR) repeat protein
MDERARELLNRGREHYEAGDYERAEECLRQVAADQFEFADVYDMLGVICHQQGKLEDAAEMFQHALRINPSYTEAALNLAVTYNDLGKYREAQEIYARAMTASRAAARQLDPFAKGKLANMHAEIGAAYHGLGLFAEAVREYEKAMALCPTFHDIRTRLGITLREMGNLEAAAREFERVRHDSPKYVLARLHLGLTYFALGRRVNALSEWQQILTIEPGHKSASSYIAMVSRLPDGPAEPPRAGS